MKTLKMQFTLDNEKVLQLNLPGARTDLTADDVRGFMNTVVTKDAFDVNGAKVTAAKAAYIETVDTESIF